MSQDAPEQSLDPSPIGTFEPDTYLEGGWRLVTSLPGKALILEQEKREQMRGLLRTAMALVIPVLLAVMLILGTRATPGDMRLVTYPLAGLFLVVAALGLLSLWRGLRRVTEGVRLELDSRAGTVRGLPEASLELGRAFADFSARQQTAPLSAVEGVRLTVHRAATHPSRKRRTLATLSVWVRLNGELISLQGPFAWADEPEWFEARDWLAPLGCELARIARRPLSIEYPGQKERFEVPLSQIDARPLPPSYESR